MSTPMLFSLAFLHFLAAVGSAHAAPGAGPTLDLRRAGPGWVELSWAAPTGFAYQVKCSMNLGQWFNLTPPLSAPDPVPGFPPRIVMEVPTDPPAQYYQLSVSRLGTTPVPTWPGHHEGLSLAHDGLPRSYDLILPSGYDHTDPLPAALIFHGHGQTAARFILQHPDLVQVAEEAGLILVLPQGTDGERGTGRFSRGGEPGEHDVDDVGFVLALELSLDRKRIYAAGFSNGGSMCHYLAATTPGWLAAIATVGTATGWNDPVTGAIVAPPAPLEPMAVLMIRDTNDVQRPFFGGPNADGVLIRTAAEELAYWTAGSGCAAAFPTFTSGNVVTRIHGSCSGTTEVALVRVDGMGHLWPDLADGFGLDANVMVTDFFLRHARP